MDKIIDGLYLGDIRAAQNISDLKQNVSYLTYHWLEYPTYNPALRHPSDVPQCKPRLRQLLELQVHMP